MSEPITVRVLRGGVVESEHRVHVAVVDAAGQLRASSGEPTRSIFPRSAAKPYQVLPLVVSGAADRLGLTTEELAVAAGSHNGEEAHVHAVESILAKAGFDASHLQCGAHRPFHKPMAKKVGDAFGAVHHNCSGKHAGMLALAASLGQDPASYLDPVGAAQREILSAISACAGLDALEIGVATDGCSAPTFRMPLDRVALLYARLADPSRAPEAYRDGLGRVAAAMRAHPYHVAGLGRLDTDLMDSADRLVSKSGAEGVEAVADLQDGLGLAIKVEDGASRAAGPATIECCRQLSWLDVRAFETLGDHWRPAVTNHAGRVVGSIEPGGDLPLAAYSIG